MSKSSQLQLSGTGAAYIRVSGDKQEVQRQVDSISMFEERHGLKSLARRYRDDMPRDLSAKRPEFQQMMKDARAGIIKWIIVDQIDRAGYADEWELVEIIRDLRNAGCRLYDTTGHEWTALGLMSFFKAGLAGHSSRDEQMKKSSRSLGGMIAKAKLGEWMGGPPKLGFDLACYDRSSGEELWRVIWEGRDIIGSENRRGKKRPIYNIRRLKVHSDGRTERCDGNVIFRNSLDSHILRITPTRDEAKLDAIRQVFGRFATESISFFKLAKWLNELGIRNSFGNKFKSNDISKYLTDEAYIGFPTFSKRRSGRFNRYDSVGGIVELEDELRGKDTENASHNIIRSDKRLFAPLVDLSIWQAAQLKIKNLKKPTRRVPKIPELYLSGLVVCDGCGAPMQARNERSEYHCGTWDRHRARGSLKESGCQRNGVKHIVLEQYISRFLDETGTKLQQLSAPPVTDHTTGKLREKKDMAWSVFLDGIHRLSDHLAKHHPIDYNAMIEVQNNDPTMSSDDVVAAIVTCYQSKVDPQLIKESIEKLKKEYESEMTKWSEMKAKRAREIIDTKLAELETRIVELEKQQEDAAGAVTTAYQQIQELNLAIADARLAMKSGSGEQALRRRAEALREVLASIHCEFSLTGRQSMGPGNARSKLATVTFHPVKGDAKIFHGDDNSKPNGGDRSYGNP